MWKVDYSMKRHAAPINCIDISQDMNHMATASTDGSVGITDLVTRETKYAQSHQDPFLACAFSPNSQIIASCTNSGNVILWNTNQTTEITTFKAHSQIARTICWSPDGQYIATGSNDKTAAIWSMNRYTKRHTLTAMNGWVRDIKWLDNLIAVAGNDTNIYIYDQRAQKPVYTLQTGSGSDISSISFHYGGSCIAAGSFDHVVRIWDLRTQTILQKHSAHIDGVTCVAFNPYNEELLSVGRDGYARLWDLKIADIACTFNHHNGYALSCCWLPSARGFVTSGEDRKICAYRLDGKPVDPNSLEMDDGDIFAALERMQQEIASLATTMKTLDQRLLLQEEKLQWLQDIDCPKLRKNKN
ncbi:hypothetical protein TVAG_286080 [Trichomonas vaginalis G3]|uniref:Uncharacterized protein n=1 Tax=Trichomonas vaginalis (strain ATCC PRA-98 / G3) TaxID=412133 RepID=A2FMV2_TRIV3|nr:growth plate cartilage chondrocyte development protein family [Trichomonas vaginalis G3]EAX93769.1 hypothetical protein TVAG_286080 [Trichomonas vaginalis G3]KAI5535876.1 growth plate cartilage chondrocyte development protein family [Trichomonas vaginalis G3]|eukprot:XP_001306699.1 hypothetical protein [Trichomonas vaginalis G3]